MYRQVYYHIQTEGPINNVQSRDTARDHWTPDTKRRQTKQRKLKKIRYTNYEYIH